MSRGRLYIGINDMSNYSLYLYKARLPFSMSGHRLGIEARRRHRPALIPYEERKCVHIYSTLLSKYV